MKIYSAAFGRFKTNCYILEKSGVSLIIDPGENSFDWINSTLTGPPLAILNTHGHYDHVFDNSKLQMKYSIPIYAHKADIPLMTADEPEISLPPSLPSFNLEDGMEYLISPFKFTCIHVPGHSKGSVLLNFGEHLFSGDFVMKDTVGRYNFKTSSKEEMFQSLKKYKNRFSHLPKHSTPFVYPGHGEAISMSASLSVVDKWLSFF